MNKKQAIECLEVHAEELKRRGFEDIHLRQVIDYLEEPITLSDFLGWQEGVEYKLDGDILKITDNALEIYDKNEEYFDFCDYYWTNNIIKELRQAKKVEKKLKAYHVKDEYSYNCLMKELEEQGYEWRSGDKPTKAEILEDYKYESVIYCKENKIITVSNLWYYEKYKKDKYDLIEYHKEESRYLLQTDLISEYGVQYLSFDKKRRKYFIEVLMTSENVQQKFTDSEILKIKSITRFAKLCEKVEVE